MADPLIIQADIVLFLTQWYREALAARPEAVCRDVEVVNREPSAGEPFPEKMLVIRDDGGPDTSIISAERNVGLSVLAGTQENPKDADDLSRIVHALRNQIPAVAVGNPVAAVLASNGPFPVAESQSRARRYITVRFAVTGTLL
ncbi:MAG: hypothetical protein ACOH14_06430 [Rhodoglobus sp.]